MDHEWSFWSALSAIGTGMLGTAYQTWDNKEKIAVNKDHMDTVNAANEKTLDAISKKLDILIERRHEPRA